MEQCADGCMAPLVDRVADLADSQIESRIHRVHERRFADAGWPGEHRRPARQLIVELIEPDALLHAREMNGITGRRVVGEYALDGFPFDELNLVDYYASFERVRLGDDQEPVEHSSVRLGFGRRENEQHLIDDGGGDALPWS